MDDKKESLFSARFPEYIPPADLAPLLEKGRILSCKCVENEQRTALVTVSFPAPLSKRLLYRVEQGLLDAYGKTLDVKHFLLMVKYPPETFSEEYIPELVAECRRVSVARGFFEEGKYSFALDEEEKKIVLKIPFKNGAERLHTPAGTAKTIENILYSEFSLRYTVEIRESEDASARAAAFEEGISAEYQRILAEYDAEIARIAPEERSEETPPEREFGKRKTTLLGSAEPAEKLSDGVFRLGNAVFDLSAPELLFDTNADDRFEPMPPSPEELSSPVPLAMVDHPFRAVTLVGQVDTVEARDSYGGENTILSIGITDYQASVTVSLSLPKEKADPLLKTLKKAGRTIRRGVSEVVTVYDLAIAACGYVRREKPRRPRPGETPLPDEERDFLLIPSRIFKVRRVLREDTAPVKRVELHLHTNLSTMDALIFPEFIVETAERWGWDAFGVTDHGNVQSYPLLKDNLAKRPNMKVLYGMEAYFVDDTARAVFGSRNADFDKDEFVVFDVETTGLSTLTCHLTEIGAVKVKGGKVLEYFNSFVDPEQPIPPDIVELTGITDEMVKGAPKAEVAVRDFLRFAGDRVLIAHNAPFDISFLRKVCGDCHIPFENTYLDTVALSRYVNADLKNHKLDTLAKYFALGDFNHHRASDDAEMLSLIFFRMAEKLKREGVTNFEQMNAAMAENADPKKLRSYHMILYAKNKIGLKNLYKLISRSYLDYYHCHPRIPLTLLNEYREGLILGSACEAGELYQAILQGKNKDELKQIAEKYDYLEIQPLSNNRFLIEGGSVPDEEALRNINRRICRLGEEMGKPVCATCDAHFLNPEEEICRKILLKGQKFADGDRDTGLYLRTTGEMLEEFSYLGEEKAYEVVVTNTRKIADMIEKILPIPDGAFTPKMEGAEEQLQKMCWDKAMEWYGFEGKIPEIVSTRLTKELDSIIKNGFSVLYMIAQKLVSFSEKEGYLVGSRGSVGSSFVASMAGISEVNPLPPHYRCPKCRYSEFEHPEVGSGFDLPEKNCPYCGTLLLADGHDIPFETFLGFHGDKSPDIDLNFSGEVQGKVHKYTEELFGHGYVFKAGTLGTLASKTAYGYVMKYLEEKGATLCRAEVNRLVNGCVGVKKTTGQHPGGIVVIPREYDVEDFTPIQHPADDPNSDIITTHFPFAYLHDTILKLDELGHDVPTKYKWMETYSGKKIADIPMNDPKVYRIFTSLEPLGLHDGDIDCKVGTYALPEAGTRFVQKMLEECQPKNFADLLQISGLSHGTDVWAGNADVLIRSGKCDISEVIGCRDDIMLTLIRYGLDPSLSFNIMEKVRKGKGLTPEWEEEMRAHDVPDWYIDSCKKIKYMFPKAHAAAYQMSAVRLAWYKIYEPLAFYAAYLSVAPGGFDATVVSGGRRAVRAAMAEIDEKIKNKQSTGKDEDTLAALQLVDESMARGIVYLPIDLYKSDARRFLPEDGKIRMPFNTLPGFGDVAADNLTRAREDGEFTSKQDLRERTKLSKTLLELLEKNGVLRGLTTTNQLSLFGGALAEDVPEPADTAASKSAAKKSAAPPATDGGDEQISLF